MAEGQLLEQLRIERDKGPATGRVFILSGPSGVGKDSVTRELVKQAFPLEFCVTATTRQPRASDVAGEAYYFLSEHEFEALKREGGLLEYALVHGSGQYGTPLAEVRARLRKGRDIMLTIDTQGALALRELLHEVVLVFLAPPSLDDLEARLAERRTESAAQRARRMETARAEISRASEYDYRIVNHPGRLAEAAEALKAILTAERLRVRARMAIV